MSTSSEQLTSQFLQFRSGRDRDRDTRRTNRSYVDHDILEGIPVRQWRRQPAIFGAPPKQEVAINRNLQSELPMPREAHLLSPMSQALLQRARAGTVHKPAPVEEDPKDGADEDVEKEEIKGFVAKRWVAVPRHLEGPEPEYLAKKRKGLHSAADLAIPTPSMGDLRKMKVRRIDSDGNPYTCEVNVVEGQKVEGEILEQAPLAGPSGTGAISDGAGVVGVDGLVATVAVQPTPPRRRPPPPRRKPKGPGRGRKKKVAFVPGQEGATVTNPDGTVTTKGVSHNGIASADGAGTSDGLRDGVANEEVEMGEGDGDEEDDEADEGEEGEEVEEGEENEVEDGELPDAPETDEAVEAAKPSISPPVNLTEPPPPGHPLNHPLPPKPVHIEVGPADPLDSLEESLRPKANDAEALQTSNASLPPRPPSPTDLAHPSGPTLVSIADVPTSNPATESRPAHIPLPASEASQVSVPSLPLVSTLPISGTSPLVAPPPHLNTATFYPSNAEASSDPTLEPSQPTTDQLDQAGNPSTPFKPASPSLPVSQTTTDITTAIVEEAPLSDVIRDIPTSAEALEAPPPPATTQAEGNVGKEDVASALAMVEVSTALEQQAEEKGLMTEDMERQAERPVESVDEKPVTLPRIEEVKVENDAGVLAGEEPVEGKIKEEA